MCERIASLNVPGQHVTETVSKC